LSKEVLKLESDLEKELFEKSFEGNEISKVVIMVDGFDEISPKYNETVIDILQVLKQTSIQQLWVTTRPHLREELEDNLQQLSYTLQPFSQVEQVECIKKFWIPTLNHENKDQNPLQIFATAIIRNLARSIGDKDKEFTGIPLQTRMLAEAFEQEFRSFYGSQKSEPELPHKIGLLGLYSKCIERKYDKNKIQADKMSEHDYITCYLHLVKWKHQLLALDELFPGHQIKFLQTNNPYTLSDELLARIGIVQRNKDGKMQFIHRTFAQYHVAEFLINQLTNETKQLPQVQELLLNEVLIQPDHHVIRAFLNGLLENSSLSKQALAEYGKKVNEQWENREVDGRVVGVTTALHTAAKEDNGCIVRFLLKNIESGGNPRSVADMLLAADRLGRTAWHKAAENDSVQALKHIWKWADEVHALRVGAERDYSETSDTTSALVEEEELTSDQIKNKLFVAKDQYGNTAWLTAAQSGSAEALNILWLWAKEAVLNPHELLLAQDNDGNTAWQLAAQTWHLKILQKLGAWFQEVELNPDDLNNKLLLAKDQHGYTVWHRAAEIGSLEALETLWFLGKKSELNAVDMFLAQGKDGNTAWQVAAQRGHFKVLEKLWEWAKGEQIDGFELQDESLLLYQNGDEYTTWHPAAEKGRFKSLDILWCSAKEAELKQEEMNKRMSLARDKQLAAETDHFEILRKLRDWTKERQNNPNDLHKKFLLAKDHYGYTVWHRVAQRGSLEELETLWGWAISATNQH
jgi:ankyrin repeat protein